MKTKGVIATTHIDSHNMKMTKEALESGAKLMNGPRKIKLGIEHDETIPPIGKGLKAWVEPTDDGEYKLMQVGELFEEFKVTTLSDGTVLLKQECESDRSPFVIERRVAVDGMALAYDKVNFVSDSSRLEFLAEIHDKSGVDFETGEFFRKSVIPDPEIVIQFSKLLVQYFIAKKVLDHVGEESAKLAFDEFKKFYKFAKAAIVTTLKYVIPKNRPVTYVFEVAGEPIVQFVAKITEANVLLSVLTEDELTHVLARAFELGNLLGAEKIQYLLNNDGVWEFNYLLSNTGAVIGTEKSFSRRSKRLELMSSEVEKLAKKNKRKKKKK
ncbi:MAG: hypothetical protein DRJ64_08960 [Thermoprotei archaeon]|nr:MAG: hypothetical protein DRJ64_08960 [Thermoprotei archaeon]